MYKTYMDNYALSITTGLSLQALESHLIWPGKGNLVNFGTAGLRLWPEFTPFPYIFSRTAQRALYHAASAWRRLALLTNRYYRSDFPEAFSGFSLPPDAVAQTEDTHTKFDIEAFLGAAVSITEDNLIGINSKKKQNRLGKSRALTPSLINKIRDISCQFRESGITNNWRTVRNSAYHLTKDIEGWGRETHIAKPEDQYVAVINFRSNTDEKCFEIIGMFSDTFSDFIEYVETIRNAIMLHSFKYVAHPRNRTFYQRPDDLGFMQVVFGPNGCETLYRPDTATAVEFHDWCPLGQQEPKP